MLNVDCDRHQWVYTVFSHPIWKWFYVHTCAVIMCRPKDSNELLSVLPPPAYYLFLLAGESQQSSDTSGPLITGFKSVGNLIRLQLKKQTGQWRLTMASTHHYTLKVIGETSVFILFH